MKSLQKGFLLTLVCLLMISVLSVPVKAEGEYYVADVSEGFVNKLESFDSYSSANAYYNRHLKEYDNLVLYENDEVLKMEYGIVEFMTNESCTLNIAYRSDIRNGSASVNGCYGIDAAYLYSSGDANTVYFRISGDSGHVSRNDVILHPYELLDVRISAYANVDGDLVHEIKTQLELDFYSGVLPIDKALPYLSDNADYYSYDGHYFYDDFKTMIDDYTEDTFENAVNSEEPYYNYYQYLSHRSLTNYEYSEIESYFYDTLKIKGKIDYYDDQAKDGANDVVNRSQYYGELKSFYEYQNIYGVNALMALSVSINESAYGKNYASFANNNLFSHLAFDSDVERKNNRYDSTADSIYAYMKYYISDKYSSYRSSLYNGSYFGNKLSGMNVEYSLDPYWGEKAAANYYKLDKTLGFKDYQTYALGIIKGGGRISFYRDEELKSTLFRLDGVEDCALIILAETEDAYKVQTDPSFSDEYRYDFDGSVAYIDRDYFDYIINEDRIHGNDLVTVTFDAAGGLIDGKESIEIKVLKGSVPTIADPEYDGYKFTGFEPELTKAEEDTTYTATYKKIESVTISKDLKKNVEQDSYLDLRNAYITVIYEDGSKENVDIDTDMLSGINTEENGKQTLTVTYNGVSDSVDVNVSKDLKDLNEKISSLIDKNIASYQNSGIYESKEIKEIKKNLRKVDYVYDLNKIRQIDAIMLDEYRGRANYRIDDNDYDLSVSGLTLSLADANITSAFRILKDTYYVHVKDVPRKDRNILKEIGEAYGFEAVDYLRVDYSLNLKNIEQEGAVVISVRLKDKETDKTYSVYRLDDNGDIVKCKTTQTNSYIQFLTKKSGSYVILSKDSVNNYDLPDYKENITGDNSDPDNNGLFIIGAIMAVFIIYGFILIIVYRNLERKEEKLWKDFKRSLLKADSALGEKPKS